MRRSKQLRRPTVARQGKKPTTGKDLLEALTECGLIGLWKGREDIGDSSAFARSLREQAQTRD